MGDLNTGVAGSKRGHEMAVRAEVGESEWRSEPNKPMGESRRPYRLQPEKSEALKGRAMRRWLELSTVLSKQENDKKQLERKRISLEAEEAAGKTGLAAELGLLTHLHCR
jgi:hypothetical protein